MPRTFWNTRLRRLERRIGDKTTAPPSTAAGRLESDDRAEMVEVPSLFEEYQIEREFLDRDPELGALPYDQFMARLRQNAEFAERHSRVQQHIVTEIHEYLIAKSQEAPLTGKPYR